MNLKEEVKQLQDEIIQFRRHIHANPELSFQEFKTTEFIKSVLICLIRVIRGLFCESKPGFIFPIV